MSLLTPGSKSTEWKLTKAGMIIGAVFLFSGKFDIASFINPEQITNIAEQLRGKADDYLGAMMVLASAAFYIAKRALLKWQEIKQLAAIEIAKIQSEANLAQKLSFDTGVIADDDNDSGPAVS